MKLKKAENLTDREKEAFSEIFCELASEIGYDDESNSGDPCPWSAPWYWYNSDLKGDTIKEMATNFYEDCKGELKKIIEEEEQDNGK